MAIGQSNAVLRQIERLFGPGGMIGMNEGQLLERFITRRDEAAFEALVARHGPMVLGVCRQLLRDPNDVDDAFQATFLVLVKKAGTLRDRHLLGNWLYGVAYRVAVRARAVSARRLAREADVAEAAVNPVPPEHEPNPWLDEEVSRLPEKYRVPVVLCYPEGLTHEEAADHLGWPVGTVKGRLARARDLLRTRLTRRGLVFSSGALAALIARDASAAVPPALFQTTLRAAALLASGQSAVALISVHVLALTEGAIQTMLLTQWKSVAVALLVAGAFTTGAGVLAFQDAKKEAVAPEKAANDASARKSEAPPPAEKKALPAAAEQTKAIPPPDPTPNNVGGGGMGGMGGGMGMMGGMGGMGGGMGGMGGMGGIRMSPAMAKKRLENARRVGIATLSKKLTEGPEGNGVPEDQAIHKKLGERIAMAFPNETPLEDVLKYIKSATSKGDKDPGIPIYVDPDGLKEAEKTIMSTVQLDLQGVPLKTTLRLALKQLGLAYCVKDGVLIISSVNGIYQELIEALGNPEENTGFQ